jgi:hypothetical protein
MPPRERAAAMAWVPPRDDVEEEDDISEETVGGEGFGSETSLPLPPLDLLLHLLPYSSR